MKYVTLGYFSPPFTIVINKNVIRIISNSEKEYRFYLVSTYLHELFHLLQFIFMAKCNTKYALGNWRYRRIIEHQAYYLNHLIAKIMRYDYDYKKNLMTLWQKYDLYAMLDLTK